MAKLLAVIIFSIASVCIAGDEPNAFVMNKLIGRGINIGGALDTPQKEGEWGVTLQDEYFQIIKDAGFNSIRLPVRWNAHAANEPPYTIDPNFFKRIDWAIENSLSRNLPIILTTHHYDELYSDPEVQKDKFVAIWKQIAERYKDYPNTLIFDPLMEALGKLDADKWNSLLNETIVSVRRSNPHRTIVICPAGLSCIENLSLLELLKDDRNIIVSIFYYTPQEFTQQGASWLPQAKSWLGTKWTGSEEEKRQIAKDFDVAAEWSKKNNRPIFLNEFGAYEKADMDSRVRWTKCVADAATQRGFSLSYWEFCSVFGLYDPQTKSWRKPLLEAIIPPVTDNEPNAFETNKLIGRGINIGNALEAPKEGEWGVTIQEEYFQLIKDAGFNSIRLPICWPAHALDEKPYTIDPNFFERIDWAVRNSLSRKLPIVLTIHHYNKLYDDPAGQKERFLALWKQIAGHYRDYPVNVIFEPLNEPHNNLVSGPWNELLKETIALIRKSNPTRTIIIGPVNYNDFQQLDTLKPPEDDSNIIVTIHYYLPYEFTHQGAYWDTSNDTNSWLGKKWSASAREKQAMTNDFDFIADWAKKHNRPIFIGECGTYEKADMDSRIRWAKCFADTAIEHDFSFSYFDFGSAEFGLYDRKTKSWRKPLLEAVLPPKQ